AAAAEGSASTSTAESRPKLMQQANLFRQKSREAAGHLLRRWLMFNMLVDSEVIAAIKEEVTRGSAMMDEKHERIARRFLAIAAEDTLGALLHFCGVGL